VKLAVRCALVLCAFIVLICPFKTKDKSGLRNCLGNSSPIALLGHWNETVPPLKRYTKARPPGLPERIDIIDVAENIESIPTLSRSRSLKNFNNLALREVSIGDYSTIVRNPWWHDDTAWSFNSHCWEWEIIRKRVWTKPKYSGVFHSVSRSGSSIVNYKVKNEAIIRVNIGDARRTNSDISSQLAFCMPFASQPQVTSGCPQSQREHSNDECRERCDRSFVRVRRDSLYN
jgi:hypothetical protein